MNSAPSLILYETRLHLQEWKRRFVNGHAVFWLYLIHERKAQPRKAASRPDVGWSAVLCALIVRQLDKIPVRVSKVHRGNWTHCSSSMNRTFKDFNIASAQVIKNLPNRDSSYETQIGRSRSRDFRFWLKFISVLMQIYLLYPK